ncbi:MAG: amino acid adenylation domain-containing protein, partial [Bacteroidota bacterium]
AIWGILKSGGAYLPLATDLPEQRLAYILQDSRAQLVLTDQLEGSSAVLPYVAMSEINDLPATGTQREIDPASLAYIIYTSGSTGQPKGVMVEHGSLLNYVRHSGRTLLRDTDQGTGSFVYLPPTFDASLTALFVPLAFGKSIYLSTSSTLEAFEDPQFLAHAPYDFLKLTPAHLSLLQSSVPQHQLGALTATYVLGGEALHQRDLQFLRETGVAIRIINEYGPTEATVGCTTYTLALPSGNDDQEADVLIGVPLSNSTILVLDEAGQRCPLGVVGEIYIGGAGLARGYVNNRELTAEKFIAHPLLPGERLYRTGDLGRWLENGNLAYHGRTDEQLKIRGYRIEAAEIEQVILNQTAVQNCVVTAKVVADQKELVAYLVGLQTAPDSASLSALLREQLPTYMIPTYFVAVEVLPLTRNGKVDYRALPDPVATSLKQERTLPAPRNATEAALTDIWQQLLKNSDFGLHDSFFGVGGHSFRAIRLVNLIQQRLAVRIKINEVFANPSIAELAQLVNSKEGHITAGIAKVPIQEDYAVSHAQHRLWVLGQLDQDQVAYNIPAAISLKGELDRNALQAAFQQLVNRHESLRTNIITKEGEPRQKIHPADNYQIQFSDWRDKNDPTKLEEYILAHAKAPHDLANGPLLKIEVLQLAEQEQLLLFNMHHIISDGWSEGILIRELSLFYDAYQQGKTAPLAPLPIQYKDFAAWHNDQLHTEGSLQEMRDYWLKKLRPENGQIPLVNLSTDYQRPLLKTYNGSYVNGTLTTDQLSRLESLGSQYEATLFMMLTALVKVFLYKYSGQTDIYLGAPSAGRNHADLDDQIG